MEMLRVDAKVEERLLVLEHGKLACALILLELARKRLARQEDERVHRGVVEDASHLAAGAAFFRSRDALDSGDTHEEGGR